MKKIIIFFILIFYSNICYSEELVILSKDVSSGYKKFFKSLTGSHYKSYGMQLVNIEDGHPVRSGKESIRFEVRSGDCEPDNDDSNWNDCDNDRERHELSAGKKIDSMNKGEFWFSWSIYFPEDHINLSPLSNNYGQFHQKGAPPVFMFKEANSGYTLVRTIGEFDYDEKKLISKRKMPGQWFDVLINAKWSKKDNGFFKVWVNDKLKYDYKGATMTGKYVYQKIGIYRTGISRYINYKNLDFIDDCLAQNGTDQDFIIYLNLQKKKIRHNDSVNLYNKCKKFYKPIEVPTTVVYFDEVRKGKSKASVNKNLNPLLK